jgi:DNA polymerase-3 subunit alpha
MTTDVARPYLVASAIRSELKPDFNLSQIHPGDRGIRVRIFDGLADGKVEGLYWLGRPGLRELVPRLKLSSIDDLVAVTALDVLRIDQPGLMGAYIDGQPQPLIPHRPIPEIDALLWPTRGLLLFQEDIMNLLWTLGGLESAEGYCFVREAAKGRGNRIGRYRERFLRKASDLLGTYNAESLLGRLEEASRYACCRAHHAAEAMTVFQSAYLEQCFPEVYAKVLVGGVS